MLQVMPLDSCHSVASKGAANGAVPTKMTHIELTHGPEYSSSKQRRAFVVAAQFEQANASKGLQNALPLRQVIGDQWVATERGGEEANEKRDHSQDIEPDERIPVAHMEGDVCNHPYERFHGEEQKEDHLPNVDLQKQVKLRPDGWHDQIVAWYLGSSVACER